MTMVANGSLVVGTVTRVAVRAGTGPLNRTPNGEPDVTLLLRAWHAGDVDAYGKVATILYAELKRQAAHCMRRQRPGDTLQTTALVHEAFLRLTGARQVDWQD